MPNPLNLTHCKIIDWYGRPIEGLKWPQDAQMEYDEELFLMVIQWALSMDLSVMLRTYPSEPNLIYIILAKGRFAQR